MQISSAGLHLIASFEGFLPGWYRDVGGVETIGYGHTGALPAGTVAPITVEQGLTLLRSDASIAVRVVNFAVKVLLGTEPAHEQARFDALVSLCFNIGGAAFSESSLVRQINLAPAPRDWHGIGPYWLEFDHDEVDGQFVVVPGLLTRRREEFALFLNCRYPT